MIAKVTRARVSGVIRTLLVGLVVLPVGLAMWTGCAPVGEPEPPREQKQEKPLIKAPDALKDRVKAALDQVANRDLLTTHSFWTVFHAILGNGLNTKMRDTFTNQEFNAVDYVRNGGAISGMEFLVHENIADGKDGVDVRIGPTFYGQGHQDQFVAEMSQLGLPLKTVFKIRYKKETRDYTFADFIRYSKANTRMVGDEELCWTMLAIAQYYGTKLSWTNRWGETIHFEDLVQHEVEQPIETAACGGTHRLFGLTWVLFMHLHDGGQMTPTWQKVGHKLQYYYDLARKRQNADGTFSTEYFRCNANAPDIDKQIGATGHIVEWLALFLPEREIHAEWMQRAVSQLSMLILDSQEKLLDGGSIYHAAHGLHLYYYRAWNPPDANPDAKIIPPAPLLAPPPVPL